MLINQNQLDKIFDILNNQLVIFTASNFGPSFLSAEDKKVLSRYGLDFTDMYDQSKDPIFLNYQLGLISAMIGESQAKKITGNELVNMISRGQHIPLNSREKASLDAIKRQSLSSIRDVKGKIFSDINNIIESKDSELRSSQEEFIRKEIYEGTKARKARKEISRDIARKTGDYSRDFSKMVEYTSHNATQQGRLEMMRRRYGEDKKVKVHVYRGACRSCNELYKDKVFTIKELEDNGSNIGRKRPQWLPTIPPLHPMCRCNIEKYVDPDEKKMDRPKIKLNIGGKDYKV